MAMILALLPLLACRPKAPDTGPEVDSRDTVPADTQHSGLDSPGDSADSEPKDSDSAPPDSPAETGDSGSAAPPESGAVVYALGDVGQKIIHDVPDGGYFQVATGDVDADGRSDLLVGASEDASLTPRPRTSQAQCRRWATRMVTVPPTCSSALGTCKMGPIKTAALTLSPRSWGPAWTCDRRRRPFSRGR